MKNYKKMLIIYLFLFLLIPSLTLYLLWNSNFKFVEYISFYQLFFAPIIFWIFFFMASYKNRKEKLIFITIGFIIPFGIIYTIAYLDFLKNFHPSF